MVDTYEFGFVFATALLAWLVTVTATDGWAEPVIAVWAAIVVFGGAAALFVAEAVDVGA